MSIDFVPEKVARPGTRRRQVAPKETAEQHAARQFAVSTRDHEMTILHDDGVYRHVRFAKPGTGLYSWTLTTWPGHLCIGGDLESYTFAREHDMFEFFAYDNGRINPHYWAEKITNDDARRGTRRYSEEKAKAAVVGDFLQQRHYRDGEAAPAWRDLRESVIDVIDHYDESLFHDAVNRWSLDDWYFQDTFEWDLQDWDHHYLIACHAVAWGIAQYRKAVAA